MGTFANVPEDKYETLSEEDKKLVDDWRNQGEYTDYPEQNVAEPDVISREDNEAVDSSATPSKTTTRKASK